VNIEIGGFSGWGLWLILGVLAFNLFCIPLWFLINHLSTNHKFRIKRIRTFLAMLQEERSVGDEVGGKLDESVRLMEEQLEQAEGLGPLWGRRPAVLAELSMHQLEHLHPELCAAVQDRLRRP